MNLEALATAIKDLDYVVMRNFDTLPVLEENNDLDLFVSNADYTKLKYACEAFLPPEKFDIRQPGDHYYTKRIEKLLLPAWGKHGGFKVPSPEAHFFSLLYHGWIHKGDDRYLPKLKGIFVDWQNPPEPDDKGVGYHKYV